jgi:hypothetical protein
LNDEDGKQPDIKKAQFKDEKVAEEKEHKDINSLREEAS